MFSQANSHNQQYWLCQVLGWMCMVLIEVINYTFFIVRKFEPTVLYIFVGCAVLGMILTHGFRYIINKRKIFESSLPYIWFYAFFATLIISFTITVLTEIPILVWSSQGWEGLNLITVVGTTINWARYVGVWIIIYFLYKILKQNNHIQQEKLVLESLAKTTELELLKAQLNPHFLFNALNSIKALVVINPEQSRDAIVKLSELLRFTLQYGKETFIPLKHEIQEVTKYLELERLRFGSRLSITYSIPEKLWQVPVPPAIVLTLAENGIKHGVAKNMGQGFLDIAVNETYSSSIVITINNSGNYQPSEHNGIGLVHVHKRLEELYNGAAKLDIHQEGSQVIVQLKLPVS